MRAVAALRALVGFVRNSGWLDNRGALCPVYIFRKAIYMSENFSLLRDELEKLALQQEKIKKEYESISENIDRKEKELQNALGEELIGKIVRFPKRHNYPTYGIIHSIVSVDMVKVTRVGFTVNNKIDRSCTNISINDLEFVSENEIKEYIFSVIKTRILGEVYVDE